MSTLDSVRKLQARMGESIIGQEAVIEQLVIGLLANGNILMEGLPGLAKTRAVKSLAKNMDADFSRIQFTPDLLPSDITGSEVLYTEAGQPTFRFEPGPIFANIVLADEINRAPAKVQAALLEAMEERQVTVAGTTHKMPGLFIVMATQNPIEQEGTYPLPDRLVRGEEGPAGSTDNEGPVVQQVIFDARQEINQVQVPEIIEKYIVDLIFSTRYPERYDEKLATWIHIGASPRGAIGLDKCSRVHAWLNGRDHALPDDVRAVVHAVLRHRIALSYEANADGISSNDVIDKILTLVAVA